MAAIYGDDVKNKMPSTVTKRMHKGSQGGEDHYYSLLVSMFKELLVSREWCVYTAARARTALVRKESDIPHMLIPLSSRPQLLLSQASRVQTR